VADYCMRFRLGLKFPRQCPRLMEVEEPKLRTAAWMALAIMVACGAWGQSQPPISTPTKATQINKSSANHKHDNSGPTNEATENVALPAPFQINTQINQPDTGTHANNGDDHPLEKAWSVFVVPALTILILTGQVFIFLKQRDIMARQADIAQGQQHNTISLERPFIYGAVSKPGLSIEGLLTPPRFETKPIEISIYNFGRTPAILNRIEWVITTAQHGGIADPIDPSVVGGRELPVGIAATNGIPYAESENVALRFLDEHQDIADGKKTVWVVGFVRYTDVFDRHFISGFTECFDTLSGRYVKRGGERYNYRREEASNNIPPPSSRS